MDSCWLFSVIISRLLGGCLTVGGGCLVLVSLLIGAGLLVTWWIFGGCLVDIWWMFIVCWKDSAVVFVRVFVGWSVVCDC